MKSAALLWMGLCLVMMSGRSGAQEAQPLYLITLKIMTSADEFIHGTCVDPRHKEEIEVLSYKAGVIQRALTTVAGGAANAMGSDFKPISIYKALDLTTPVLLVNCAFGQHFPSAKLTVSKYIKGESVAFFTIDLSDVVIASVNEDSQTTDPTGVLVETATLSYSKIQWTYRNPDRSGSPTITAGFDVKTNKKTP